MTTLAAPPASLWSALLEKKEVQTLIELALAEDIGSGDVTTDLLPNKNQRVEARIFCRSETVVCGNPLAQLLFAKIDPQAETTYCARDGELLTAGQDLLRMRSTVGTILTAERVVLNFLMRLCGVAHTTHRAVAQLPPGSRTKIYDTRKTLPGWRYLDKAAVRAGGGYNHRIGLFDAILIKDNHLARSNSLTEIADRAKQRVPKNGFWEIEVTSLTQLHDALAAGAKLILLDNFDDTLVAEALAHKPDDVEYEISGGITHERLPRLAALNVDRVSMGALTHSAPAADLSLEFIP